MFKKIFYIITLICLSLSLTGCQKTSMILFNKNPITKENLLNNSTTFTTGKKIYYVFLTQNPLDTNFIRVRILKRAENAQYEIGSLVYSNDFRLNKDQVYYYNDYIVMNEPGYYYMVIYAINALDKPLASADFRVQ